MIRAMQITVEKAKYDGEIVWFGTGNLVRNEAGRIDIHFPPNTVTTYKGRSHPFATEQMHVYWTDRWYNVWAGNRNPGRQLYCNVAMPPTIDLDNGILRFVDLDIDVALYHDGRINVFDDDEFEQHRRKYAYPADVVAQSLAAREALIRLCRQATGAFDWHSLFAVPKLAA